MKRIAALLAIFCLILSGCAKNPAGVISEPGPEISEPVVEPEPRDPGFYTGMPVEPEKAARRPVAVMIDNDPNARPQSGLKDASVVYEMLAEGGLTRFMALFSENDAEKIGPVRSARHYFVYTAAGHGAVYAHCGGSPQAKAEISELKLQAFDDMKISGVFTRTSARVAPHNLYTSTDVLREHMEQRGWGASLQPKPSWVHSDEQPEGTAATKIGIPFSSWYRVKYEYQPQSEDYIRYIGEKPHIDAEDNSQITVHNLIILYIKSWQIPNDPELRLDMDIVGSGDGMVFSNGVCRSISWSKASKTSDFVLRDDSGKVLALPKGNVWIHVVPPTSDVSIEG